MKRISQIAFILAAACLMQAQAQQPKGPISKPALPLQTKIPVSRLKMSPVERALAPQWPLLPSEFTAKKDKAPDDETQARALATEGVALMRAEKFEEALAKFRQAEKLLPREYSIEMNIGNCLMQLDRAGDAVSAFEKAAAIRPDSPAAHAMICSSRAESGDRSGAIDECRLAVKLSDGAPEYKARLSKMLVLDDRVQEALEIFNSIPQTADSPITVLGPLADLLLLAGQNEQAAAIYEQMRQRWPNVALTYYRLSYVYEFLDRPQQTIAAAQKYAELKPNSAFALLNLGERMNHAGFFEESLAPLTRAISMDPSDGEAYLLLSDGYKVLGDKDNALRNLEFAYQNLPPDLDFSYQLGHALIDYGRMADAVAPLERANALRPNYPPIMTSLGLSYFESNQFDPAIEILTRADQMKPNDRVIQMFLKVAKARKDIVEHFDDLLEKLKKDPDDPTLMDRVASGYQYRGMWKDAEREYLTIIAHYPKEWKPLTYLAIFYTDTGHLPEALDYYQRSAALTPNHVTYLSISDTLEKLGRLDEAIEAARHSVQIKGDSAAGRGALGVLLLKKGDRTGAMEQFQAAFGIQPDKAKTNFDLAWLYLRNGDKAGAIRHYRLLQTIVPDETADLKRAITAHFGPIE